MSREPIPPKQSAWVERLLGLLLPVLLVLALGPVQAQTPVTGTIASSTAWRAAEGPYVLDGAVTVQSGAVLEIEAGTIVHFAPGASLTVQSGAVRANGTATQRVLLTSQRSPSGTAARGDWTGLSIRSGSSGSRFDYADIEFGTGVEVTGATVTFNNTRIRSHQGAAIRIDLAASLLGGGNEATDNDLNAVSVPAGEITGGVQWLLRGIAFHVANGTVSVGTAPGLTNVAPGTVVQGDSTLVSITGSRLAGASRASFGASGVTGVIQPGATDTQVQVQVAATSTAAVGATSLTLLTDAGEAAVSNAITVLPLQPRLEALAPAVLVAGQGDAQVTLTGQNVSPQSVAVSGALTFASTYVSPTQMSITVPNQATAGSLPIQLRTPDPLSPGQFFTSNSLTLSVIAPVLALTPANPKVIKGQTQQFTLTLPYASPAGGLTVNLSSSVPSVGTVPTQVLIPVGATSQSFSVSANEIGTTTITADRSGFVGASATLIVEPPPRLTVSPPTVSLGLGRSATVTVSLSTPAGVGGVAVDLRSSEPGVAALAAASPLMVAQGATSATAEVRGDALGQAVLSATASGFEAGSAAVTVRPVTLSLPSAALVAPALSRFVQLTLSDPAPVGGLPITFQSSNAAVLPAPVTVLVAQGQTRVDVQIAGGIVGAATLTATAAGYQAAAMAVTVEVVTISINAQAVSTPQGIASLPLTVSISQPAPVGGLAIGLAVADPSVASVTPAEVVVPQGQTIAAAPRPVVTGVREGATALTASAPGLVSRSLPVTVTPPPALRFSSALDRSLVASVTVARGFKSNSTELSVERVTRSTLVALTEPVVVTLTSSDPSRASVPATVTIPANASSATFEVVGVDLSAIPVVIDATAAGYASPARRLAVDVVAPLLRVCGVQTERPVFSAAEAALAVRDDIWLCHAGRYPGLLGSPSPATDLTVEWTIVDSAPTALVPTFFSAATGGTAVSSSLWPRAAAGAASPASGAVWISAPTLAGVYRVRGAVAGVGSATSEVVNVGRPALRFNSRAAGALAQMVSIGKDFKTDIADFSIEQVANGVPTVAAQPVVVALTSSDPTRVAVPPTITIPAGASRANFVLTGVELTGVDPVIVNATASGYAAPTVRLEVQVVPADFSVCGVNSELQTGSSFAASLCTFGNRYFAVASAMSPARDLTVDWSIADATSAGVVDGIFDVGGATATRSVWRAAATGGFQSSSEPVRISAGQDAGAFRVQGSIVGVGSATSGLAVVSPTGPTLRFFNARQDLLGISVTVGKGFKTYVQEVGIQRRNGQFPTTFGGPLVVSLTTSDPSRVTVPASVTIPSNQSSITFEVTGVELTGAAPVSIAASAAGYAAPPVSMSVAVVAPSVDVCNLFGALYVGGPRTVVSLCSRSSPFADVVYPQSPVSDLRIDWQIVDEAPPGLVAGFFSQFNGGVPILQTNWPAASVGGLSTQSDFAWIAAPTSAGTLKVRGTIPSLTSATSQQVQARLPTLAFARSSSEGLIDITETVLVGKGMRTSTADVYIERRHGSSSSFAEPVTLNLACASAAVCRVPPTITLAAGQSYTTIEIEGVDLGSTTLSVWADGYESPPPLPITTVIPDITFDFVNVGRVGQPAAAQLRICVPEEPPTGFYGWKACEQTATVPLAITLSSSAPGVATVPATTVVPEGSPTSGSIPIATLSSGQTTITAAGMGFRSASRSISVTP